MKFKLMVLATVAALALAQPAFAAPAVFTGSGTYSGDGHALSAKATFDIVGSSLQVTLTNTDSFVGAFQNPWGLTGIFWDLATAQSLTAVGSSATVASGAILNPESCDVTGANCATATNVGGEFRYQKSPYTAGAPSGIGSYGISSSGYIGGSFNMNGPNLDDPVSVDGRNFSILGANATGLTPTGDPSIKSTATFLLPGLGAGFTLASLSNVAFTYVTAWGEATLSGSCGTNCGGGGGGGGGGTAPEPGSLALVAVALLGIGLARKRLR